MRSVHGHGTGFTLLELSIALLATSVITLGSIKLAQAVSTSSRLQQNLSALNENARFAAQVIGSEIRQSGYQNKPWAESWLSPFKGSANNVTANGDKLVIRRLSDDNCYDNQNDALDDDGRPAFFVRVSRFEVSASGQFAVTCYYGPDEASLVRQVNRLGLVEHVRSFQTLFALDQDGDGNADAWSAVVPGDDSAGVLGVRVGLLLLSPGRYHEQAERRLSLLDEPEIRVPAKRLHTIIETTWPVMGQLQS